jgi:N-acetylmuramoyl-L-alanine amidase
MSSFITVKRDVKPRGSVALFLFFVALGFALITFNVAALQFGDPYGLSRAMIYITCGVGMCFGAAFFALPTRLWYSKFWRTLYKDTALGLVTMCLVLAILAPSKKFPTYVENSTPLVTAYVRHLKTLPSDDEVDLMTRVLYGEARGENEEGQRNIVHTIINRAEDSKKRFGPTYSEILIRPFQFSCMNPDDPNYPLLLKLDKKSLTYKKLHAIVVNTINERLNGRPDPTLNSTHYHNLKVDPKWNVAADGMIRIGNHKFWRGVDN